MFFLWDGTYILVIIGAIIVMFAQSRVKSTFNKYSEYETKKQITGKQAAETILQRSGINDVKVEQVQGELTDHYDPSNKVLRLSEATYDQTNVAAVAVAAHECGHAIQDAEDYAFLRVRTSLVPIVNIGSSLAFPLIIFGLLIGWAGLMNIGIIAFGLVLLFQLVTLPVEFNASNRALAILEGNVFTTEELPAAKKVLNAAAFTYVAASLSTALQLLRFILLSNRRD